MLLELRPKPSSGKLAANTECGKPNRQERDIDGHSTRAARVCTTFADQINADPARVLIESRPGINPSQSRDEEYRAPTFKCLPMREDDDSDSDYKSSLEEHA
jgi:hypothetical protein